MNMEVGLSDPLAYQGRVELHPITSSILAGNPLGDPHVRQLPIYLPPGHTAADTKLPCIYLLPGFTGNPNKYLSTHPWKLGIVARFDRAVTNGTAQPAILVMPDCFTCIGGSQYVNSSAVGRYQDYIVEEIVPFVDANFPVLPGRRGVVGTSSGGFGALHLAMHHSDLFPVAASVSGDCCFEYTFKTEMLSALRGLVAHSFEPAQFLKEFQVTHELAGDGHAILNILAMSACYSPNPEAELGFDLPMDLRTGELLPEVWERWLSFDPLRAAEHHVAALQSLDLLYLEAGLADQFNLQWGLRRLVGKLKDLNIPHEHHEHGGSHFGLDPRYDALLPKLAETLLKPACSAQSAQK
ncbi:MAG: S-formylglutathione hydrolase FrmB [Planctomycetota bacterium]|jgi:S-formylglutathione hydrolase FrmB